MRDAIAETYPDQFADFNERIFKPAGFPRPLAARERKWKTPNGKANFTVPAESASRIEQEPDIFQLITLRADGQFNTTIYTEDDRFRGVKEAHGRADELQGRYRTAQSVKAVASVALETAVDDGVSAELGGLEVCPTTSPRSASPAYYPECNVLIPLWHYAEGSKVPAAKSVPVRISLDSRAEA